jgi:small redox-active disulfide protein 2
MKSVKVLGTGCPKCNQLAASVQQVARDNGIAIEFEKVSDMNKILEYGVMMTPALVVDGEVKVTGKVPRDEELKRLLL